MHLPLSLRRKLNIKGHEIMFMFVKKLFEVLTSGSQLFGADVTFRTLIVFAAY
jgi:hypothetical protein